MPRITPTRVVIAGVVIVGDCDAFGAPATGSSALASPKSSTLTVPSGRSLMLAGFRSRWTMPCSCAASSASAICLAIGSASSSGIAPARDPLRQVVALDQFHHERVDAVGILEPVDRGDVRMIERGEHPRFAFEAGQPVGIVA